ncbi:SHREC complex ATP-dependent chromatin remodeller Mit1 [Schizosaccharomyces osmophilus]|uniref:SHREC complex ATP-dependent chromatin remodeller Mit1 n=1 Tax=Schizosaccharomyces osmophilus TaxID=2545709 RepID=A0AAF0AUC0_9SCHI|nr:SHREC complex ATP-dependent chromatin remodeller Mit1 [Schizosaccharomyces osmophilus]WBW70805.1 SHREC complex ATP-dependent chromatin remodeller Mit1 [Schizosaccharomyces osmophilus]
MPVDVGFAKEVRIPKKPLEFLLPFYDPDETTVVKVLKEHENRLYVAFLAGLETSLHRKDICLYKNGKRCYQKYLKRKRRIVDDDSDYDVNSHEAMKQDSSHTRQQSTNSVRDSSRSSCRSSSSERSSSQGADLFASASPKTENDVRSRKNLRKQTYQSISKPKLDLFQESSSDEGVDISFQMPDYSDDSALTQSSVKPIPLILNAFAKFTHTSACTKCHHHEGKDDNRKFIYCKTCTNTFHVECSGTSTLTKIRQDEIAVEGYSCSSCSKSSSLLLLNNCILSGYGLNDTLDIPSTFSSANDNLRLVSYTKNVRFRCWRCKRVLYFFYYDQNPKTFASSIQKLLRRRLCDECVSYSEDVEEVLAWRLLLPISLLKDKPVKNPLSLDRPGIWSREYYVRPKNHSYLHCFWCSASWLAGVSNAKKRNFDSRETDPHNGSLEIIPPSHITIDKVWDVQYKIPRKFKSKEKQMQALAKVDKAYVSWRGLPYSMSSWEFLGDINSFDRWKAWKEGYSDYVRTCWIEKSSKSGLSKDTDFNQLELTEQPSYIFGGKLMPYQLQGVNWLYFHWVQRQHCILADEMGLGKTVQIISFISVLYHRHHCFPFLIVVPHATVANWEREFHKWDSSLLIATLVGSERNRDIVRENRIYRNDNADGIRTHVLIVSTSCVDSEISLLRKFRWQCMIIDEGQRLKSDQSSLFNDLISIDATFKALLTGTPLQNNIRELFNLLQFLNPEEIDASELERQYQNIDEKKVTELHQMLKPFFLRRVKEEVLDKLPPKIEVIVPLTMTPLQKRLYKLIVSKNVDLIQSIVSRSNTKSNSKNTRASLSNILMQLRKTLAHPYLYSADVEVKEVPEELSIRSLEEASAKMLLLRLLLPKLIMRGHRILIFSQFILELDILEDWMDHKNISYSRFDGTTTEHDRQVEIDSFNAPNSKKSCFLLTTRAGGVGINLASADTVIILDPDFNPHQDMQAVARAHRYGQDKKVFVFSLIIRNSAEEKILQAAQKKMLLDRIIVQSMRENNESVIDLHEVLQHGVRALFEENEDIQAIRYDEESVENLITDAEQRDVSPNRDSESNSTNGFGFARVWVNNKENITVPGTDNLFKNDSTIQDDDIWSDILRQRERVTPNSSFSDNDGRKLRQRKTIMYEEGGFITSSDEEYNASNVSSDESDSSDISMATSEQAEGQMVNKQHNPPLSITKTGQPELASEKFSNEWSRMRALLAEYPSYETYDFNACIRLKAASSFMLFNDHNANGSWEPLYARNVKINDHPSAKKDLLIANSIPKSVFYNYLAGSFDDSSDTCKCCGIEHVPGRCPLNRIPLEICFLCGTPHFSGKETCPLLKDKTTVKILRNLLANSREPLLTKLLALKRLNDYLYEKDGSSS